MSETPTQPDWNHIRAFLATAETGSLSAAARQLGLTQPTLSRQISALEDHLNLLLFDRIGRRLELTASGLELLEHSREMGAAATLFTLTASGQSQSIKGEVSITASDIVSANLLPAFLHRLHAMAPDLKINVVAANDIRDLMRREADIAIRHVRPEQPDLIAKLIVEAKGSLYGAEDYLARHGTPKTRLDLRKHRFVSFGDVKMMIAYLKDLDIHVSQENFPLGSENGLVAWQYAVAGFGLSLMDEIVASQYPHMRKLVTKGALVEFPVWLVTHPELHKSRRIRLVYDQLGLYLNDLYKGGVTPSMLPAKRP